METPDYYLPEEAIAQVPAEPRDAARLLVALGAELSHKRVADLPGLLGEGDVLVVNGSRVVPARLQLQKDTGGAAEVLLLEPRPGPPGSWEALVRPGRRLAPGTVLYAGACPVIEVGERLAEGARVVKGLVDDLTASVRWRFPPTYAGPSGTRPATRRFMPIDPAASQPRRPGCTSPKALSLSARAAGSTVEHVDLAVGLGTFRPIKGQQVEGHTMHPERYSVPDRQLGGLPAGEAGRGRRDDDRAGPGVGRSHRIARGTD